MMYLIKLLELLLYLITRLRQWSESNWPSKRLPISGVSLVMWHVTWSITRKPGSCPNTNRPEPRDVWDICILVKNRWVTTVKPVLSGHSKRIPKLVFKTDYRLMQVKCIAECSKGSILQYFRPSLRYHLSLTSLFCLFLSGRLRQVLLYTNNMQAFKQVVFFLLTLLFDF